MRTVRQKRRQEPEVIQGVIEPHLPIHEKVAGRQVPAMSRELLDLIHMMMRVRQLELDLLGRYVFLQSYPEVEKLALAEALEQVLQAAEPLVPTAGGRKKRMSSIDPEVAGNRCPAGFHEQDGRCVPD